MTTAFETRMTTGFASLQRQLGEPVSYTRYDGTAVATGFPKSITVLFRETQANQQPYDDGEGRPMMANVSVVVDAIGSNPQIENDRITRDSVTWTVERIVSISGGVAFLEVARYEHARKSSRDGRIRR